MFTCIVVVIVVVVVVTDDDDVVDVGDVIVDDDDLVDALTLSTVLISAQYFYPRTRHLMRAPSVVTGRLPKVRLKEPKRK